MFFKLGKIFAAFQLNARRHWLFTALAIFWIISPFDDAFLPVIDEVLIAAFWIWQAYLGRKNKLPAKKALPSQN